MLRLRCPDRVIIDLELRAVRRLLPAHGSIRPRRGMGDGVVHRVRYRTTQLLLIAEYLELLIHLEGHFVLTAAQLLRLVL